MNIYGSFKTYLESQGLRPNNFKLKLWKSLMKIKQKKNPDFLYKNDGYDTSLFEII